METIGCLLLGSLYLMIWIPVVFRLCVWGYYKEHDKRNSDKQTEQLSKVNYLRNNLNEETDYESS